MIMCESFGPQVGEGTQLIVQDDSGEHITLQVAEEPEGSNIVEQAFHVSTTIEEEDGGTAMLVSAAGKWSLSFCALHLQEGL